MSLFKSGLGIADGQTTNTGKPAREKAWAACEAIAASAGSFVSNSTQTDFIVPTLFSR